MRGSRNEAVAISAVQSYDWVYAVYSCGMLGSKDYAWIACSPHRIALLLIQTAHTWGLCVEVTVAGAFWPLACIAVKTAVSRRTLDPLLADVSGDFKMMHIASQEVRRNMQKAYVMQVLHQMAVNLVNMGVYVCTSEY